MEKGTDKNIKKRKPIVKSTHLYLQEKGLKSIPPIEASKTLQVIYLYGNEISTIDNLEFFPNLTSLYLQENNITAIDNLHHLPNLQQLYLGRNKIEILEKLQYNFKLEELYIEKQSLQSNNILCVDPRTITGLSDTLQILDISHNRLSTLSDLKPLRFLRIINASFNDINDVKDICQTISNWLYLSEANFSGNPCVIQHRYRESIIANAYCLKVLDGKNITDINRTFIKRFEEEKLHNKSKNVNLADVIPELPKNYPQALQKAASRAILKKQKSIDLFSDLSTFDEKNAVYIAWQGLPAAKPLKKSQFTVTKRRENASKAQNSKKNFIYLP